MWEFAYITDYENAFGDKTFKLWRSLKQDHVFNSPELIRTWIDCFTKIHKIDILWILGSHPDGNKSLWPLVIWHRNWKNAFMRVLMPAGGGDFDYHSPMFMNPLNEEGKNEYFSDLIEALKKRGNFDELVFSGIPDKMLPSDCGKWIKDDICPYMDLTVFQNEEDLLKFFKTNLRKNLQRRWRRLSELGTVELVDFKTWKDASLEFDAYMSAHAARWPNAYVVHGFHKALLTDEMLAGPVSFTALRVGDQTVAWHLGFEDNDCFYYYRSAVNPDFYLYSPGNLHLWQLVKRAIDRGLKVYDHLRGEELYKDGWSNGVQYVNSLHVNGPGFGSKLRRLLYNLRKR